MAASTRFALAVHVLSMMARDRARPQTSQALAKSANTNPAVVRRLLGALSRAGLTQSRLGKGGGTELAKGPKKISMADIFKAVEEPGLFTPSRAAPAPSCPVGRSIGPVVSTVTQGAEFAFLEHLDGVSLKQIVREIAAKNAAAKSAA